MKCAEGLRLSGYGVGFGPQVVLASVTVELTPMGMTVLVGPMGCGKSTLLRTLAGFNDAQPSMRTWGDATLGGAAVADGNRPALVSQNVRLLAASLRENLVSGLPDRGRLSVREQDEHLNEYLGARGAAHLVDRLRDPITDRTLGQQRLISIFRTLLNDPPVLMVDEPTAGLRESAEIDPILHLLATEAGRRAVVVVTHHQGHARHLAGRTVLLAGGRIQEIAPTERFLTAPATDVGRVFVRTGSCRLPSPMARAEDLAEDQPRPPSLPPAARASVSAWEGPREFRWLRRGALAGLPRPGIVGELEHDIEALVRVGVTILVTLEERLSFDSDRVTAAGIAHWFFPIEDMDAPSIEQALRHCARVDDALRAGATVALHCRAGLGRTGTMLVAQLIFEGASAVEALARAREINPRWVQSDAQVQFLEQLEVRVKLGEASRGSKSKSPREEVECQ